MDNSAAARHEESKRHGSTAGRRLMAEKTYMKAEALAFGHSLQAAFKTVIMYSVDHPATEKATALTYASLNKLVRQTQQFTFGFLNKRVLINELLTDDGSLSQLEGEFFRRGIGAITFSAGITLNEFKHGLAVISIRPKAIEEKGGLKTYVQQNPIAGMRILPAVIPEGEDTVLQMSPESYLMAQGILGPPTGGSGTGLEALLRSVGMEKPNGFSGGAREALDLAGRATQSALMTSGADPRETMKALVQLLDRVHAGLFVILLPLKSSPNWRDDLRRKWLKVWWKI